MHTTYTENGRNISDHIQSTGCAVTQLVEDGRSRVRFPMMSLEFLIYMIILVDPDSKRNEFQECLGGKVGRCVELATLPPSCADILEIWEPQSPGKLRAHPGLSWDCFTSYSERASHR